MGGAIWQTSMIAARTPSWCPCRRCTIAVKVPRRQRSIVPTVNQSSDSRNIQEIFETVSRLPHAQQEAALLQACTGDAELQARLRRMLEVTGPTAPNADPENDISLRVADWARRRDAESATFWHGRRIGDFVVRDLLGQGGMGVVVSARRDNDETEVALKLVRPDLISAGLVRRLQREHDMLSRLDHPGIAHLHGLHLTSEGAPFLEMEKIDGESLDLYAERRDLAARVRLLEDVARVVGYAHTRSIVHRDLKPNNVLVTAEGQVKLLDFGIAKTIEEESLATMTATAERLLTPRYAAPEQLLGGSISAATDVFSLGVMLCELCLLDAQPAPATTQPLNSAGAAVIAKVADTGGTGAGTRLPLPRDAGLRQIALRAQQAEPTLRYANASEFADELQRWRLGETPRAGRWSDRLHQSLRAARLPVRGMILVGVIALIGITVFAARQYQQQLSIDDGFGFIEHDLAGLDSEGRAQARRALSMDAGGARETALGLIQNARQRAPAHPLLTYLELTWNDVPADESERQYVAASAALKEYPNAYLQALLNAETRASASAATRRKQLNSALQIRPNAWRLRLALAHGDIGSGKLDSALKQLQQIDTRDLHDRRAAQILADRALLGDSAGARAAAALLPADRSNWREWVLASVEFREGDYASALQRFERIGAPAMEAGEPTVAMWGRMGQAICLGQAGRWTELAGMAARELRAGRERGDTSAALRNASLGAIAAHQQGDRERLRYFLDAGRSISDDPLFQIDIALTAVALGEAPGDIEKMILRLPDEAESLAGLPSMLRAAAALHAGDTANAAAHLRSAQIEGVADTRLAEVARWYQARVDGDRSYRAPDSTLWFAPWCNWVAAWVAP
jgi:Protein kinase domain